MNPTELATAVQEGLKITVLISKNDGFQCIRDLQLRSAGRLRERVPHARRVVEPALRRVRRDRLRRQRGLVRRAHVERLDRGRARDGARGGSGNPPVRDRRDERPVPARARVGRVVGRRPAEVSSDPATTEAREEYERGRAQQRYYG
jgi:3D-(3,5/4)-trihydroxycyclohexane-1,2-dione acylhydrolase (decyclizing)